MNYTSVSDSAAQQAKYVFELIGGLLGFMSTLYHILCMVDKYLVAWVRERNRMQDNPNNEMMTQTLEGNSID